MSPRIALGTAQFGQIYGIANRLGQVTQPEAGRIVAHARRNGIDTLDTAAAYAGSEQWLGAIGVSTWAVITKIPALPAVCDDVSGWVNKSVDSSLGRLRLPRIEAVLVHKPSDLLGQYGSRLHAALVETRNRGLVRRIGISAYDPDEVGDLVARFQFDIVQAPFNVFDQRMVISGMLKRLTELQIEFHSRSTFLQGLLLMDPATRPPYFKKWDGLWKSWHAWLLESRMSAMQACLQMVLSHGEIGRVIVGVDSEAQLDEILAHACNAPRVPAGCFSTEDLDLLNPSRWPRR